MSAPPFRLGPWHVHPDANEVRAGDRTVRLEPKAMGVLVVLAARAGEVVRRDEIEAAVWPDVVVTEASLTRCVSQLRQALGDDPRAATILETVPTVGYRLRVVPEPLAAAPAGTPPPGRWTRGRRRVAGGLALAAVAGAVALALWAGRPAAAAVEYRVETRGAPGTLAVQYTRAGGDTTEHVRAFPVVRVVPAGDPDGRRYAVRAEGAARDAEVRVSVRLRRGDRVLAQAWAMGQVAGDRLQTLDAHTHVDGPPGRGTHAR